MEGKPPVKILEKGMIEKPYDILHLNFIDWGRLNNYWDNLGEALDLFASWLVGRVAYTIVEVDMHGLPDIVDFPSDWTHEGAHEPIAIAYWNWWHLINTGRLVMSDEPDFWGELTTGGMDKRFWGDIGQVSASTFAHVVKGLHKGDIWISIPDDQHQIILEPLVSLYDLFNDWDSLYVMPGWRPGT